MIDGPAKVKDKNQIVSIKRTSNLLKTKVINLKHDESSLDEESKLKADIQRIENLYRLSFAKTGLPPGTKADFYRIGRALGRGAFGKVSLCMHKLSQQLVAIKSIKKDSETDVKRSTLEEMSILQSIKHDNVIGIYDSFET
jgi:serine/threonine protein kinase